MRIAKKFYIAAASLVVAVGALVVLNVTGTSSQAISSFRNCNADAIIKCGAITEAELLQKYDQNVGDVQSIYAHYGITRADLAGTASDIVHGTVYRDGRVVVNGKTVATGAYSVSRVRFTSAGTPRNVVINGTTYYEGPSMQIFTGAVDAFIYMRNGQFHKAVLSSCGNPLIAVPEKPKPVYKCENLTATKLDRARFRFTAAASATNAEIVSYNYNFGDGNTTTGGNVVEHTYAEAGTYTVTVTVNVKVDGKTIVVDGANCNTTVTVEKKPEVPVYKCESLTAQKLERDTFRFKASAIAENGARVVNYTYDFGDGTKQSTLSDEIEHTYAEPGTYTATLTAHIRVGDETKHETGPDCQVDVEVKEKPVKPVYRCDNLTPRLIHDKEHTYAYTLEYTAEGGATLTKVVYDFGDGNSQTVIAADEDINVEHQFAEAGNYTTTATLYFEVPKAGEVVEETDTCETQISIPKDNCPIPGKEEFPKDSDECKYCPIPGKEDLPYDSEECVETPPELPKTGLDMFIGGGIGLGSITAAGYYWSASRKNVLDALLKR